MRALRSLANDPDARQRWLGRAEAAGLALLALVIGRILVPAHIATSWADPAPAGRVAPIANRLAHGVRLYADGGHTTLAPLAFVLVRLIGRGHASWLLDSALTQGLRAATLAVVFVALSRRLPRPIPALATLAAGALFGSLLGDALYDALGLFFVAVTGLTAQGYRERIVADSPSWRAEARPLAMLGGLGALALLSRQNVGAGAGVGVAAILLASPGGWSRRGGRLVVYGASLLGAFAALTLLSSAWLSPRGMLHDAFGRALLPPGGASMIVDRLVSFGLEQTLVLVVVLVALLFAWRRGGARMGEKVPDGAAQADVPGAPLAGRLSAAHWIAAAVGVALAQWAWPRFLGWSPVITVPGTRGYTGFPLISFESWNCADQYQGTMGFPSFLGVHVLQGCWVVLFVLALRSLRHPGQDGRWMMGGLATLAIVFLPASLAQSFTGDWPRWAFAESLQGNWMRWTFAGDPLVPVAFAVAFVVAIRWRPARLSPRVGLGVSLASTGFLTLTAWSRLEPTLLRAHECDRTWADVDELRGARMRPDADRWAYVAKAVQAVAPDATQDRVLMLPEDPEVETWFARPRPALSSLVLARGEYPTEHVAEDLARLEADPPKVILTGPEEVSSEADGEFRPLPSAAREPGEPGLLHQLESGLLAERYERHARFLVPFQQGTARPLGHVTMWVLRPAEAASPRRSASIDWCSGHSRPLVVYWNADHTRSETFATTEGAWDASETKSTGNPSGASVCTTQVRGSVALESFYHVWVSDYFTTATPAGKLGARYMGYLSHRIEGFIFPEERDGTVPLQLLFNPVTRDFLTTASPEESRSALDSGYVFIRIEGYAPRDTGAVDYEGPPSM